MEKITKQLAYVRIYFDRGSSQCVVDTGVGTTPFRVIRVYIHGYAYTEYAPLQNETIRPRFWLGMRDVVLVLDTDTGILHVESKVEQWQYTNTNAQTQNAEQSFSMAHHHAI